MAHEVLGRDGELHACEEILARGGSVVLRGPAGIGKSTVLSALAQRAAQAGDLVLRASPTSAEAGLPHLALVDMFAAVSTEALPEHLRHALDGALLRTPASPTDQLAVRVAVTQLLRALAADRPVLVVIDDAQLVDPASAAVLSFAARRLSHTRVRTAASELSSDAGRATALCPEPVSEVEVGALPPAVVAGLVRARLPEDADPGVLDRICAASGGNPLFAQELARAYRHGSEVLPVPDRLRSLLATRLHELPESAELSLLMVAAAARPGYELFPDGEAGVAAAVEAGILVAEADGALRFHHPLLADLVYGDAEPRLRQVAHTRLASLVPDPVERARHRALATDHRDEGLALELVGAADLALSRGAPSTAASLLRLASGRTPDPVAAARRLLDAAAHAATAGLVAQAKADCTALLRRSDPVARVGARTILADLAGADVQAASEFLTAAAVDAADHPALAARVHRMRTELQIRVEGVADTRDAVHESVRLARESGDVDVLIEALGMCIPLEIQSGHGAELPALAEAADLARGRPLSDAIVWVRQAQAILLVRQGEVAEAVDLVQRLLADVSRAGRTRDLARVHYIAAAVLERAGRCRESAESGLLSAGLWADVDLPPAGGFTLRGAAALNTGTVPDAVEALTAAIAAAESTKDPEWAAYAHILHGRADLLQRRPAEAARHLSRGLDLLRELGYLDPALILVHADLAEALVLSGDPGAAQPVLDDGRACATRYGRSVVLLGLDRSQALADGFTGDPRAAADSLRSSMALRHAYPLEVARCALALATLERRARRRAAARTALAEAIRMFDDAGCTPWAAFAQESLDQLDPADAPESDLERRLLDLVRSGASNRTIAATLHLSVKAVEANLTRLYRRFGVSGRTDLLR